MAHFREIKRKIIEESIRQGRSVATGPISNEWVRGLEREWKMRFREAPRLVNHFTIGAKVMVGGRRAGELRGNIQVGGGFAKVNSNTRSVLVTAKSSRRVLEVVGNLAFGMQGMDAMSSHAGEYEWESGGWLKEGFPLSGKIEFGRLRTEGRLREVAALDEVMELLIGVGVFSREEQKLRNTWQMNPVGLPGDWERKSWGWEYRGFPSFVESPAQAMLVLTLAKLAVYRPDLWISSSTNRYDYTPENATRRIIWNLAFFRGLDDDAELCWEMIRRHGLPTKKPVSINTAWGMRFLPRVEGSGIWKPFAEAPKGTAQKNWGKLVEGLPFTAIGGYDGLVREIPKGWMAVEMVPAIFRGALRKGRVSEVQVVARLSTSADLEAPNWWADRQKGKLGRLGITVKSRPEFGFMVGRKAIQSKLPQLRELFCDGSIGVWTWEDVVGGKVREPRGRDGVEILYERAR